MSRSALRLYNWLVISFAFAISRCADELGVEDARDKVLGGLVLRFGVEDGLDKIVEGLVLRLRLDEDALALAIATERTTKRPASCFVGASC